jgi:hypothetical protein
MAGGHGAGTLLSRRVSARQALRLARRYLTPNICAQWIDLPDSCSRTYHPDLAGWIVPWNRVISWRALRRIC